MSGRIGFERMPIRKGPPINHVVNVVDLGRACVGGMGTA